LQPLKKREENDDDLLTLPPLPALNREFATHFGGSCARRRDKISDCFISWARKGENSFAVAVAKAAECD
jgi:hypothetical protein